MASNEQIDQFKKRATNFTQFNFLESDFTSLTFKQPIRELIHEFYFPSVKNLSEITTGNITKDSLNAVIKTLQDANREKYFTLFNYIYKTPAPGEVLMYFIVNNAHLGGASSAGIDLVIPGGTGYEIKAVEVDSNKGLYGFFTGRSADPAKIIDSVLKLSKKYKLSGNMQAVSVSELRKKATVEEMNALDTAYGTFIYDKYFKSKKTIFFNKKTGYIEFLGVPEPGKITMQSITQSQIKPRIQT